MGHGVEYRGLVIREARLAVGYKQVRNTIRSMPIEAVNFAVGASGMRESRSQENTELGHPHL